LIERIGRQRAADPFSFDFSCRIPAANSYILRMSLLALFFSSFGVGFSGALMPGPLLTVDIAESTRKGFWTGPIVTAGHAIAELVVVILLAVGLADGVYHYRYRRRDRFVAHGRGHAP
jgi:hypothetical protein